MSFEAPSSGPSFQRYVDIPEIHQEYLTPRMELCLQDIEDLQGILSKIICRGSYEESPGKAKNRRYHFDEKGLTIHVYCMSYFSLEGPNVTNLGWC